MVDKALYGSLLCVCYVAVWCVDGRLGSRLRGYHPIAPRLLRYGSFVHRRWFRSSFPEGLHVKRHDRPLLVKDGIGREMAGQFRLRFARNSGEPPDDDTRVSKHVEAAELHN
jgi:hypothetical protein